MHPSPEDLQSLALFEEVEPQQLGELATWFEVLERDTGAFLTKEGDAGYEFYLLRSGTAAVTQGDQQIRTLGPGDCFGELSIVGDGRRTASVQATSPVSLWRMFGTSFRSLEQQFPEVAERIRTAYA